MEMRMTKFLLEFGARVTDDVTSLQLKSVVRVQQMRAATGQDLVVRVVKRKANQSRDGMVQVTTTTVLSCQDLEW